MSSGSATTPPATKLRFQLAWIIPLLIAASASYILWTLTDGHNFAATYGDKFRSSLFTGFLTAGSFLLALKTFILVRMDADVYNTPEYRKRFESAQKRGSKEELYAPLRRLGSYVFLAIIASFGTSLLQLTLGLWSNDLAAIVCVGAAFFTMGTLFVCLFAVRGNLMEWFRLLDERRNPKPSDPEPDAGATLTHQ